MIAEYLIHLPDGTHDGPYTEEDLLDMVDADELAAGTFCEDTATGRRCRVSDLFKVIPPSPLTETNAAGDAPLRPPPTTSPPARWVPAPLPEPRADAAPAALPARTVHAGHPSLLNYWRSMAASLALMAGGWYAGRWEDGGLWLAGGWLSGSLWLALTLFRRSAVEYRVTTRRVETMRGFLSKSSQEIRIADIRAINVRKSGFSGLLGVGDVIFSASGGAEEDVVFHQTAGAHNLKNRVRRLQDRAN